MSRKEIPFQHKHAPHVASKRTESSKGTTKHNFSGTRKSGNYWFKKLAHGGVKFMCHNK